MSELDHTSEPNPNVGHVNGNPADSLITEEDAAKRLGKGRQWLRNLRLDGEGPQYVDLGNTVAYFPSDVDAWLLSRRKAPEKVTRKKAPAKPAAKAGSKPAPAKAAPKAGAPKSGTNQ